MDNSYVVVGYIPLLKGSPGQIYAPDAAAKILEEAGKTAAGMIQGCAWVTRTEDPHHVHPVFVIDRAKEIADHLVAYAEGVPQRWFNLYVYWSGEHRQYIVALTPNAERVIERFRMMMQRYNNHKVADDARLHMVYVPLAHVSHHDPDTFLRVQSLIPPKAQVKLIDTKDFGANPGDIVPPGHELDETKLIDLGLFTVHRDSMDGYLERILGT